MSNVYNVWTREGIMENVEGLSKLGINCPNVDCLPKDVGLEKLTEAWEIDRRIAKGIANDIGIWT